MKLAFLVILYIFVFALAITLFFFIMLWATDKSFRRRPTRKVRSALNYIDQWIKKHS